MPVKKKAEKKAAASAKPARKKVARKTAVAAKPRRTVKKTAPTIETVEASTPEVMRREIEVLAYRLWEERGRPFDGGLDDWVRAEELLRQNAKS